MHRNRISQSCVFLLWLAGAALTLHGCSPIPDLSTADALETFEIGQDAAERGDLLVAIEAFKKVTVDFPLDALADDAVVALADVYRAGADYAQAEAEYRRLMTDYPRSPLVPEAEYKLGLAYMEQSLPPELDQTMTNTAIAQLRRFLDEYPDSEFAEEATENVAALRSRLAEKLFLTAKLYLSLKSPEAARVYLGAIATGYPNTEWAPKALLEEARSFAREGLSDEAEEVYRKLIERYPGTDQARLAQVERSSG